VAALVVACAACGGLVDAEDTTADAASDGSSLEGSPDSTVADAAGADVKTDSSRDASPSPDTSTRDAGHARDAREPSDASAAHDVREARDAREAGDVHDAGDVRDVGTMPMSCNDDCALGQQECSLLPQVCTYDDAGFTIGCQPQVEGVWTCVVASTGCTVWGQAAGCSPDVPCCLACDPGACPLGDTGEPCQQDTDCASDACDAIAHQCVSSQCADHRQDGTESDIDCGGLLCDACGGGKRCLNNLDCRAAEYCSSSHVCVGPIPDAATPPPCQDACVLGDQECSLLPQVCTYDGAGFTVSCEAPGEGTWTCVAGSAGCTVWAAGAACSAAGPCCAGCQQVTCDAGVGSLCWSCPPGSSGQPCEQDTDCVSNACDALSHACTTSQCADQRQDGLETDVDCGGPDCTPCLRGQRCLSNRDCLPGNICVNNGYWDVCN